MMLIAVKRAFGSAYHVVHSVAIPFLNNERAALWVGQTWAVILAGWPLVGRRCTVHPERFLMIHHAGCFVRGERSSVMAMADVADVRSAQALADGPRLAGRAAPGTGSQ